MRADHAAELKRCLEQAYQAFESGDDATARRLCREALALDPESSTAHSLMGLLYEREGRLSDATGEFETVLERNPRSRAERTTLERLRSEDDTPAPLEEEASAARTPWAYVVPAVAALLVLLATVAVVNRLARRDDTQVAASTVAADLAAAREAFNRGDYRVAADSAQRVLGVEPNHLEAREIYDRSMAFLRAGQPPASGPAAGFGPQQYAQTPPPQVESVPAWGGQPGAPADAGQGGTVGGATSGPVAPRYTPQVNLPEVSIPTGPYQPGQPYYSGGRPSPPVRPRVGGPLVLGGQPRQTVTLPAPPEPITPPQGYQPPPAHPDSDGGRIRVTVDPPRPRQGAQPSPEVAPDLGTPSQAQPAPDRGPEQPEDPAVQRFREEQERLREARERQRNAQRRRLQSP